MTQATCSDGSGTHVLPDLDTREHSLTAACWCEPEEDIDVDGLWVHNSADGREDFEEGLRDPS